MLPTVVANELRDAVGRFLRSAFPFATPFFQRSSGSTKDSATALIDALLEQPGEVFQGPYLDIKLPFRLADGVELPFRNLSLPFTPYRHQIEAFQRLSGDAPRSTIVATGTGSGKTECFMLPVLDDCLQRREPGIKTIVIYPMNALATDQARRFAAEVAKLDTRLTVGLYVGGEQTGCSESMRPDQVITCRKTLRQHPPDILLTNYKMLDFLLIRPQDRPLWRRNKPGMLRYLVVDELHSFDGAQGTDLACLIRRLRDRLGAGAELACVGTSATIGPESKAELLAYASEVFAAPFDEQSIIIESRLSAAEYLDSATDRAAALDDAGLTRFASWPDRDERRLDPANYERAGDYLFHQARLWFAELPTHQLPQLDSPDERKRAEAAVQLGELLHRHQVFHQLLLDADGVTHLDELAETWRQRLGIGSLPQARQLLASLTSLISAARQWDRADDDDPAHWCKPFLQLRQQLWLRELRRMVCSVPTGGDPPALRFADDLKDTQRPLHLPLLQCRECHLGAWGGVIEKGSDHLNCDPQRFYQNWFGNSPQSALLVPLQGEMSAPGPEKQFCSHCLRLQPVGGDGNCVECERDDLLRVWLPNMLKDVRNRQQQKLECHHDCPECGARESLAVVGYQAATLISTLAGRLFATPYNNDFKLIAFSDSVQDAAHRAGFLGANTWRQVVRQAMAGWLRQQPLGLSLREMADLLPNDWRRQMADDARYCGLFIAPNMAGDADYDYLTAHGRLPPRSKLPEQVSKRLAWECLSEFGRRSKLGRSLERTGVAAVGVERKSLARDMAALAEQLRNEVEALRSLTDEMFAGFVLGWLTHLREIGAIYDPVLDGYLGAKGREYMLNAKVPWMPGFGRTQRPPAAITLRHVAANFEALLHSNRDTWSVSWLKKTLGAEAIFVAAEAEQIFTLTVQALAKRGWLIQKDVSGESLWLLNPDRLLIERDVCSLRCNTCRHAHHTTRELLPDFSGMPCLRTSCSGHLTPAADVPAVRDYGVTEPRRLVPAEHTGLLPRDLRDAVEKSFKQGAEPWDVNLLSATPTLEMGIDIGDLSSVFLCSVPPAQANYLQRIGRAGRRDGNALAVTVANGHNHDLYFYQEPLEMIAGSVQTPGVFLQAIAVLERQLIAYCFDRWTASGIDESAIPGKLGKALDAVQHQQLDCFPYNLLNFVSEHRSGLLCGFLGLFDHLDGAGRDYLEGFIKDAGKRSISLRLVERLQQLVIERASLLDKVRKLKREAERLKKRPEDEATHEEIQAVNQERNALLGLLGNINSQPVLNFFTDEGLLPNYAFPEEGVTLRSVILRRRASADIQPGEAAFDKRSYSFQRPAQAALGELAPERLFYAVAHEMQIDQIDLQLSEVESWRFCDRCQHTERVDLQDAHSACPNCGSAQWADSGQRHSVLRLRQVYSTVEDRRSRIADDAERREPVFFNRQMLVKVENASLKSAFCLKSESLPFGFEYLRQVTVSEVNFGSLVSDSHSFSVAGRELARNGFRICRHCGKVQNARWRKFEQPHAFTCKLRKQTEQERPEDYFESLYLYRELKSEAIRILLPLAEVAYSDEKLHSFIAALNLGLKAYFRGDVHHLEVTDMREPPTEGSGERIYLVIYDRIPGGTGYLKELMRSQDNLMRVLELARERLIRCPCVDDEHKDGCYRCILAYRNSRHMPTISRRAAAELLGEILARRSTLEAVSGLRGIDTNALIESKLEQRFVDALAALPGARMSKALVNGKHGSLLTLPGADGSPIAWQLEHQVGLGPDDGVAIQTKVDVMLRPARVEDVSRYRPIAVYLDGLQYHHERVDDDVCKRSAILLGRRYWVWTLGWDDLPSAGRLVKPHDTDLMRDTAAMQESMDKLWCRLTGPAGWIKPAEYARDSNLGGLEWLSRLLRDPGGVADSLRQRAAYRAFSSLVPSRDQNMRRQWIEELKSQAPTAVHEHFELDGEGCIPGGLSEAFGCGSTGVTLLSALPGSLLQSNSLDDISQGTRLHLCLDDLDTQLTDTYRNAWRAFWHAANQLQFLPGFSMATLRSVADGRMQALWASSQSLGGSHASEKPVMNSDNEALWSEVLELSVLDHGLLQRLMSLAVPVPAVGVDLADASGQVVVDGSDIELLWREAQVAIVVAPVKEALPGWRLILAEGDVFAELQRLKEQGIF